MKTVEISIYEFDELDPKIQEILKNNTREAIVDERFEVFGEYEEQYLKDTYDIDGRLCYSLSYCQGDGLHFETKNFLTLPIIALIKKKLAPAAKAIFKRLFDECDLKVSTRSAIRGTYMYATRNDCHIEYDDSSLLSNLSPTKRIAVTSTIDVVVSTIKDIYMQLCKDFENIGYQQYEVDESEILERLREEQYYANGMVYMGD